MGPHPTREALRLLAETIFLVFLLNILMNIACACWRIYTYKCFMKIAMNAGSIMYNVVCILMISTYTSAINILYMHTQAVSQ